MALDFGKLNFSTSFNPTAAFPLDARCYFENLELAKAAVLNAEAAGNSDTVYYFGQQIAVVENDIALLYIIEKVADESEKGYHGDLKEVGAKTLGDEKSIVLEDGILSLNDFGKKYWKYVAETTETAAHYEYVDGFKEGLVPQIKQRTVEGVQVYKLEWYEQNPTTVEGLAGEIAAIKSTLGDANNGLVKDVADLQQEKLDGIQIAGNDIEAANKKANIGLGAGLKYDTTAKNIYLDLSELIIDGGNAGIEE